MNDRFLEAVGVETVEQAMKDSLKSALGVRRGSKIYKRAELKGERKRFRAEFAKVIIEESRPYIEAVKTVPDIQHREAINRISQKLSSAFSDCLCDEHLRHGIAQKAFNLYLKYLWRLGIIIVPPPHCPIDWVVLTAAGIDGSWTKSDDEGQYYGMDRGAQTKGRSRVTLFGGLGESSLVKVVVVRPLVAAFGLIRAVTSRIVSLALRAPNKTPDA